MLHTYLASDCFFPVVVFNNFFFHFFLNNLFNIELLKSIKFFLTKISSNLLKSVHLKIYVKLCNFNELTASVPAFSD